MKSTKFAMVHGLLGGFIAFGITTSIVFGDPVRPFLTLIFGPILSTGLIYWVFLGFGILCFAGSVFCLGKRVTSVFWRWATVTTTSIAASAIFAAAFLTVSRNLEIDSFKPDRIKKEPIMWSFRIGMPLSEPINKRTHAIAMKDCKPFNWSWTRMSFLRLPHNIAINYLPSEWFVACGIDPRPI